MNAYKKKNFFTCALKLLNMDEGRQRSKSKIGEGFRFFMKLSLIKHTYNNYATRVESQH